MEEQADVRAEAIVALGVAGTRVVGASYGGAVALNLAAAGAAGGNRPGVTRP